MAKDIRSYAPGTILGTKWGLFEVQTDGSRKPVFAADVEGRPVQINAPTDGFVARALVAPDEEVGAACMNVEVPETIDMTELFREAYVQGYRHALADVREVLKGNSGT